MLRFLLRDLHPAELDDAPHHEIATLTTRLRFTSNPVLVILLGVMIVVACRCSETMLLKETTSPRAMLLIGLIPELLLVSIIARASIRLWKLQTRFCEIEQAFQNLRTLTASLIQSISADRSNLGRLHHTALDRPEPNSREVTDRIVSTAVNFEHTYSIAQRLGAAVNDIRRSLSNEEPHSFELTFASSRIEPQHVILANMKLRTLPNGSLDRDQLVELR